MDSEHFTYYGGDGPVIPQAFRSGYAVDLVHGAPAYRVNFPPEMVTAVVEWIESDLNPGPIGVPRDWHSLQRSARRPAISQPS
jgi:hypothetical protein